jgi:hypothetical protein
MMFFESDIWIRLMTIIGEFTFFPHPRHVDCGDSSCHHRHRLDHQGKFYLPQILIPGMFLLEGLVKAFCKLLGLDDRDLITFSINAPHSTMNTKAFAETPVEQRAVFLPQSLRSAHARRT